MCSKVARIDWDVLAKAKGNLVKCQDHHKIPLRYEQSTPRAEVHEEELTS